MNTLISVLEECGFTRLSSSLSLPIIVHCVPGAGKSRAIRELLRRDRTFRAYTLGRADPNTLQGDSIAPFTGSIDTEYACVLDEYHLASEIPKGIFACFGDPQQSPPVERPVRPDFIASQTHRFGKNTALILHKLGYTVEAHKEDTVIIEDIFTGEPIGTIVYFEEEVGCLLRAHNAGALNIKDAIGSTFREVTFVTTGGITPECTHLHYLCLTRHTATLKILSPDATYGPA